jgi:hypothetical protein
MRAIVACAWLFAGCDRALSLQRGIDAAPGTPRSATAGVVSVAPEYMTP